MRQLILAPQAMRHSERAQRVAVVAHRRLILVTAAFLLLIVIIIGRLVSFSILGEAQAFQGKASEYIPARADMVDRNGVPLARTIPAYSVWVRPDKIIGDPRALATQIHGIFPDMSEAEVYAKLTAKKSGYLKRRILPEEAKRLHYLGEPGIEYPQEPERLYPEGRMAAHVLGFSAQNGEGQMGMEKVLNARLKDPDLRSTPVELSLDARVQGALEFELQHGMDQTAAKGATGIVLDVTTGEVMAMATLPAFNPNKVTEADIAIQSNGVTNSVFELGSTFKPITVAAALDAGTVRNLALRYDATGPLLVDGHKIRDLHSSGRWLNVPEALVHSSNVVTARIADNLGIAKLQATMRALDFDKRPAIELAERGMVLWPKHWGRVTNMTVGYGHGIAVTPLHLASAYAALVNGGIYRPATMLKVKPGTDVKGRRVFTAATSARMRQLLRMIVVDGTGKKADAAGFRVGGKTGSAEKPHQGGYSRNSIVSTFAAAFPMDNPRYVVLIMLDEPKGTEASSFQRTAGYTSAPVVARLVPRIGPMLGVYPDENRDVDVSELTPLLWSPKGG